MFYILSSLPSSWKFLRLVIILFSFSQTVVISTGTAGCGCGLPLGQSPAGPSVEVPIQQSNGVKRVYSIYIPSNYDQNIPTSLIFSFHGRSKNSSYQEKLSGLSRSEWNPDAIVVYPQGLNNQWQGDPESVDVDDLAFVSDMISSLSDLYCLDSRRIYATGKSNGGGLVNSLACDARLSTQIAAFAPVSGAFYIPGINETGCMAEVPQTTNIPCSPGRNDIPILDFHGLQDATIPYNGGPRRGACLPTILHWLNEWADREGFSPNDFKKTTLYDGNVVKYEYAPVADCMSIITHYSINGLGHDWPEVNPNLDNFSGTYLDATPMILDFFRHFKL